VRRAALQPVDLDEYQANAVAARIELDLRIGAAFTRLQTLQLQTVVAALKEKVISYGKLCSKKKKNDNTGTANH
jgi:DNA topoisomerase-3